MKHCRTQDRIIQWCTNKAHSRIFCLLLSGTPSSFLSDGWCAPRMPWARNRKQQHICKGLDPLNFSLMSIPPAVHSLQPAGMLTTLHRTNALWLHVLCFCYKAVLLQPWHLWCHSPPHDCPLLQASCPSYYLSSIINATHMPRHTCTCIRIHTHTERHACASTQECVQAFWDPAISEGLPDTPSLWLIIFFLHTFQSEPHIMIIWNRLKRTDGKAGDWIYSDEEKLEG